MSTNGNDIPPWQAFVMVGTIGVNAVVNILLGIWIGYKIDSWLQLKPLFTIVGIFLGFVFAVISSYYLLKPYLGKRYEKKP